MRPAHFCHCVTLPVHPTLGGKLGPIHLATAGGFYEVTKIPHYHCHVRSDHSLR
jgi:hypothetical protein